MASVPSGRQSTHSVSSVQSASSGMGVQADSTASTPSNQDNDICESRKQEIGDILQQIMNITDQSLDEAQAR